MVLMAKLKRINLVNCISWHL